MNSVHDHESILFKLTQRNRELQCLFDINALIEASGRDSKAIVRDSVPLMKAAFVCPGAIDITIDAANTRARIEVPGLPLDELFHEVTVFGKDAGFVRVLLTDHQSNTDKISRFLDEERALVTFIVQRLGRVIERITEKEMIHSLTRELIELQERERKKIAYDLHDGVVQTMLAAKISLEECRKVTTSGCIGNLDRGLDLLNRSILEIREVCDAIYPSILNDLGLEAAVNWLASMLDNNGIEVVRTIDIRGAMSAEERVDLFRIIQELFANILKHSGADTVNCSLEYGIDGDIYLEIGDNGLGYDTCAAHQGMGQRSIAFRAGRLSCGITVESSEGEGTLIIITRGKKP